MGQRIHGSIDTTASALAPRRDAARPPHIQREISHEPQEDRARARIVGALWCSSSLHRSDAGGGSGSPTTVNLQTIGSATDVAIVTAGKAAIATAGEPGLVVNSGGAIDGRVTSIATQGDGASGALLRAADGVVFDAGDLVSTPGDQVPGLGVQGRSVAVTGNAIQTGGNNSSAAHSSRSMVRSTSMPTL
jgi:hypothetical protein